MTINKKIRLISGGFAIVLMTVIFILSAQVGSASDEVSMSVTGLIFEGDLISAFNAIIRKLAHISEYAALTVPVYIFFSTFNINKPMKIVIPFLFSVFYAATDEFHQLFVEGRSGQIKDVLIDSIGVVLGLLFVILLSNIIKSLKDRGSADA